MGWLRKGHSAGDEEVKVVLDQLKKKFDIFSRLLEKNNHILSIMSDLEEKAQGDYVFDTNYIRNTLDEARFSVEELIWLLVELGGDDYKPLKYQFDIIDARVEKLMPGNQPIPEDDFIIPFDKIESKRAFSVGSKNAHLGEMKTKLGLPVPEGFAISAWAYKHFIDSNDLQTRISEKLKKLDIKQFRQLEEVSREINDMLISSPVPDDLAEAIRTEFDRMTQNAPGARVALRSSALGEDTLFSFAGQYATYLNVTRDNLLDRYRDIIASKFTPKAIYYFLSHSLTESELAMSVGCVAMVDAAVSGVIYSRDPVNPDSGCLIISSLYGLGKNLVDGKVEPDRFRVSRQDINRQEIHLTPKPICLVSDDNGQIIEIAVPISEQLEATLDRGQIRQLAEYTMMLERHYGCPQDIEFAIDHTGQLYFLQARPLRVLRCGTIAGEPDIGKLQVLLRGGFTVCPGVGGGPVYNALSTADLADIPDKAVVVAPSPFPGLITAMGRISALVTKSGGVASHMATIAREFHLPTIMGLVEADRLRPGDPVTVDACRTTIFDGYQRELIEVRRIDEEIFNDTAIYDILDRVMTKVSPLNLIDPTSPEFVPEKCMTLHDITRYAHQKAMDEMFTVSAGAEDTLLIGVSLKSKMPLNVRVLYLDQEYDSYARRGHIKESAIESVPMRAFWSGIVEEGWPVHADNPRIKGLVSFSADTYGRKRGRKDWSDDSLAVLGETYMMLSMRMGYHYTTFEAVCTEEVSKNFIRMQYKEGGASLDRRIRRIRVITEILTRIGFENYSHEDFLNTIIAYQDQPSIEEKLRLMGRLTMMTKQLDMALSSDDITDWYIRDIARRLGLKPPENKNAD